MPSFNGQSVSMPSFNGQSVSYPVSHEQLSSFTGCPQPQLERNTNSSNQNLDSSSSSNHNSIQTAINQKPSLPHSPVISSSINISPSSLPTQAIPRPSPPTYSSSLSSSSSSAERITPTTASIIKPLSADPWNQPTADSSSNYLNRNHIPPPICIPSPLSSSSANLKSNLDPSKNYHQYHHPSHNLLLGGTTRTNKPIDQHSNFLHFPQSLSPLPLSAPIISTGSHQPTTQLKHPQAEHLQLPTSPGFQNDNKVSKDIKRRTTKACDNCRKSKCKCTRALDPNGCIPATGPCQNCVANNIECTFNGTSRKRGPPKGYIEAIELRLHRMEALLGGLLENDDPRAQALFLELIGDNEVRDLLTSDLKMAAQQGTDGKPRKSWKPSDPSTITSSSSDRRDQLHLTDTQKVLWGVSHLSPISADQDHRSLESGQPNGQSSDPDDDSDCEENQLDYSPPPPPLTDETYLHHKNRRRKVGSQVSSINRLKSQVTSFNQSASTTTIPHTGIATFTLSRPEPSDPSSNEPQLTFQNLGLLSPQQHSPGTISELADVVGQLSLDENDEVRYHGRSSGLYLISASQRYKDFFWQFPKPGLWPAAPLCRSLEALSVMELVNPLELLQNQEMMYHLLDLYWTFVHPMMPILYKPEFMNQFHNLMENIDTIKRARPHWSLNQIWSNAMCSNSSSIDESLTEPSEQPSPSPIHQQDHEMEPRVSGLGPTNRISILLLLVMFSISSRYSDRSSSMPVEGQYWNAGDDYLEKAKQMLNLDYGNSKLTNCQSLILMAYREIGAGAMAESWLYTGMAIRMAQDMGLFRDVDKWFMPVKKFTYVDKQIRKRVWWACVNMDKYVSTYLGKPMMIFERDYDTAFPSADEPDEHERWEGCTSQRSPTQLPTAHPNHPKTAQDPQGGELAGTKMSDPMVIEQQSSRAHSPTRDPTDTIEQKSYTISCFNRAASLSVLISRIVANIYAIRIRVIGQSSETLLSLLDQNLARWYLDLPEQLRYRPHPFHPKSCKTGSKDCDPEKRAPTPHLLTLHAQFYTALILLHRPFIPASRPQDRTGSFSGDAPPPHPSHSICTTAANAITHIAQTYHEAFGLRHAPAFLVYYIFTASILHVNNASSEPGSALTAKSNLLKCMQCLKEMAPTWTGAVRAWELLSGLVDLRDVDVLENQQPGSIHERTLKVGDIQLQKANPDGRGLKRPASSSDVENYMSHSYADQNNSTSFSAKPTTGSSELLPPPTDTARFDSRSGFSKSLTPSGAIGPHENRRPVRSVSKSDWSTITINVSKSMGDDSGNPSGREPIANVLHQDHSHSKMRSPQRLICPETNSSQREAGRSKLSVTTTSGNRLAPSPTAAGKDVINDSNYRSSRESLGGEADMPFLHVPPAPPTVGLEEMASYWRPNPNSHEHYHQVNGHQAVQQRQPPFPSNLNQVSCPFLFNFPAPTGHPPYGSQNQQEFLTKTIQGILGLSGSSRENVAGMNEPMNVEDHAKNERAHENHEERGRVVVEKWQQQNQPMSGVLLSSNQNTIKDGTLSDLGLNWFASPVDSISGFTMDPSSSPTLLNAHSQSLNTNLPPHRHHQDSLTTGVRFGDYSNSAIHH